MLSQEEYAERQKRNARKNYISSLLWGLFIIIVCLAALVPILYFEKQDMTFLFYTSALLFFIFIGTLLYCLSRKEKRDYLNNCLECSHCNQLIFPDEVYIIFEMNQCPHCGTSSKVADFRDGPGYINHTLKEVKVPSTDAYYEATIVERYAPDAEQECESCGAIHLPIIHQTPPVKTIGLCGIALLFLTMFSMYPPVTFYLLPIAGILWVVLIVFYVKIKRNMWKQQGIEPPKFNDIVLECPHCGHVKEPPLLERRKQPDK